MSEDIKTLRNNLYSGASPAQRYLYSHPDAGLRLSEIAKKHNVSNNQYVSFVNIPGDVVLGIHRTQDMTSLLENNLQIDPSTAQAISRDLIDFLAPLSDPTWQPPTDGDVTDLAAEVSALEGAIANQFPQNRPPEPTYTSTQAAILNEGKPEAGGWETR
jgi:hypothetical protein